MGCICIAHLLKCWLHIIVEMSHELKRKLVVLLYISSNNKNVLKWRDSTFRSLAGWSPCLNLWRYCAERNILPRCAAQVLDVVRHPLPARHVLCCGDVVSDVLQPPVPLWRDLGRIIVMAD